MKMPVISGGLAAAAIVAVELLSRADAGAHGSQLKFFSSGHSLTMSTLRPRQ